MKNGGTKVYLVVVITTKRSSTAHLLSNGADFPFPYISKSKKYFLFLNNIFQESCNFVKEKFCNWIDGWMIVQVAIVQRQCQTSQKLSSRTRNFSHRLVNEEHCNKLGELGGQWDWVNEDSTHMHFALLH